MLIACSAASRYRLAGSASPRLLWAVEILFAGGNFGSSSTARWKNRIDSIAAPEPARPGGTRGGLGGGDRDLFDGDVEP